MKISFKVIIGAVLAWAVLYLVRSQMVGTAHQPPMPRKALRPETILSG